jgi:hypothetical protein
MQSAPPGATSGSARQFAREIAAEAALWEQYRDAISRTPLLPR